MNEPLGVPQAKKLIQHILRTGSVAFSSHALEEMRNDDLTTQDCVNILRAGVLDPPEYTKGTWRYRLRGGGICVVAAFRSERELVVVTAWRIRR